MGFAGDPAQLPSAKKRGQPISAPRFFLSVAAFP
jgi:hypothetical protein